MIVVLLLIWNIENLALFLLENRSIFKCQNMGHLHLHFKIFLQVFAMPETALGFLPGVGATYFLSRLPGFYGYLISLFFV